MIGRSLQSYGEWAESEVDLLAELIPEGGTVVDAGAFIGTHTLAMAAMVGAAGQVFAVEGQPAIRALLRENVEQNRLGQVAVVDCAVGAHPGTLRFPRLDLTQDANFAGFPAVEPGASVPGIGADDDGYVDVPVCTLDDLVPDGVDVIKADVEGMEVQVLRGAERLLASSRPHLYLECASVSNGLRILELLLAHGYRAYMHRAPAFNPDNFFGNATRIFGLARETNLLGIAEERLGEVEGCLSRHPALAPVRNVDELAVLHLTTVRWGEPEWSTLTKPGLIARMTRLLEDQDRLERLVREMRTERESAVTTAHAELLTTAELRSELEAVRRLRATEAETARQEIEALRHQLVLKEKEATDLGQQAATRQLVMKLAEEHPDAFVSVRRLFDAEYYREQSPDLDAGEGEPLNHYLTSGGRLGTSPHRLFDSSFYLERNADVRASGLEPLVHYVLQGASEGRDPHLLFSTRYYLQQAPEAGLQGTNPLIHFIAEGCRSGLDPHPLFDTGHYLAQAPDCLESGLDPVSHYRTVGAWRDLDPHPLFDTSYYLRQQPGCEAGGLDPLSHFLLAGPRDADPHPFFSCADYRRLAPEVQAGGDNPLLHFVTQGRVDGRLPRMIFDLGVHKHQVTELDELRHDGRRVVLFLTPGSNPRLDAHLRHLAELIRDRCVALHLRGSDERLFGGAARGLLALSPVAEDGPGLLFDPARQLATVVAVLRGVGVTRVHVHHALRNETDPRELLRALDLPFDLSLHQASADAAGGSGRAPRDGGPGGGARNAAARLRHRLERRWRLTWLTRQAERVIVPAAEAGGLKTARFAARSVETDAGDFYPERYLDAEGLR